MFSKEEYQQLQRYDKGDFLLEEDRELVERLASIGLVSVWVFIPPEGGVKEKAKLTSLGSGYFRRAKIEQSWWRRILYHYSSLHW